MKVLELQDIGSRQPSMESLTGPTDTSHLHPGQQFSNRRSPSLRYLLLNTKYFLRMKKTNHFSCCICRRDGSPLVRTPSPRRRSHLHPHHDVGFSDTVSNVVEIVKEERGHRGYRPTGRYPRGTIAFKNFNIGRKFQITLV